MSTKRIPEEVASALDKRASNDTGRADTPRSKIEKELAAAGFDVEMEKAEARAWRENLERDAAAEHPGRAPTSLSHIRSLRPQPRRAMVNWVAAVAAVALVGGGWVSARWWEQGASAPAQRAASVSELRAQAFEACRGNRWRECLSLLDEAKKRDPAGDEAAVVQQARAAAASALPSQ
jgi:hypothetical protein